jgi:hypothetical protein
MLKYRIYIALLSGFGFASLVLLVGLSLASNLLVSMIGVMLLMPGISLLGAIFHDCCQSPLPILAANGLIYSGAVFVLLVWPISAGFQKEDLRRFARIFTLVVIGVIALGWGSAGALEWAWSAPSDEALTKQFNKHRGELETLVAMTEQDSAVSLIAYDFIDRRDTGAWPRPKSEWGITEDRWNEYRALFRKIGLGRELIKDEQGNIYFMFHSDGSVVTGSSKGLVYCPKAEATESRYLPCIEQRDSGKSGDEKGNGSQYHRLSEHWYIYSDWD